MVVILEKRDLAAGKAVFFEQKITKETKEGHERCSTLIDANEC
jgi:hypothetical protein